MEAIQITTTKSDKKHFPAQNQSHFCWQKYNEFVLCSRKNHGDEAQCNEERRRYSSICPIQWTSQWDEERSEGRFLGVHEKGNTLGKQHHH